MKQQDWIDYFEAVNGRSPEPAEIAEAIAKGEFQVEMAQGTTASQTVAQEPVVASQQATPSSQVNESGQGVTQAPLQFQQVQGGPGQSVYNVQVAVPSKVTVFWKQFWEWLVSAWKKPTSDLVTHPFNGWTALALLSFFSTLVFYIPVWKTAQSFSNQGNNFFSSFSSYFGGDYSERPLSNPYGFGYFLQLFIGNFVFYLSTVLAGFLSRSVVYQEKSFTFNKSLNYYGRLYSVNLLLAVVTSVLLFVDAYTIAGLLTFISFILSVSVNTYSIAGAPKQAKADAFYQYLIAAIVSFIIISIALTISIRLGVNELLRGLPLDVFENLF